MGLDLALGFNDKSEAPAIAGKARETAQCKGTGVPGWRQQAFSIAQFVQSCLEFEIDRL